MRRNITSITKFMVLCLVTIMLTVFLYKTFFLVQNMYDDEDDFGKSIRAELRQNKHPKEGSFFNARRNLKRTKIDWHDYRYIEVERDRVGVGEQGAAAFLKPEEEPERKRLFSQNGFNGYLSDKISLNRSVADIRHKE